MLSMSKLLWMLTITAIIWERERDLWTVEGIREEIEGRLLCNPSSLHRSGKSSLNFYVLITSNSNEGVWDQRAHNQKQRNIYIYIYIYIFLLFNWISVVPIILWEELDVIVKVSSKILEELSLSIPPLFTRVTEVQLSQLLYEKKRGF